MKDTYYLLLSLLLLLGCLKSKQDKTKQVFAAGEGAAFELFREGNFVGYKDIGGLVAIRPQFAEAGEFSDGLARVKPDAQGPWGFINTDGETIISPQFEGASDFIAGRAVVLNNNKFLYINKAGKAAGYFEANPPYKALSAGDTLYVIHPNGLIVRGLADSKGDQVGQVGFDEPVEYRYDAHPIRSETINGLRGTWLPMRFGQSQGYCFDAYLSRFPQAKEKLPLETHRVVVSSERGNDYSVYTLTKEWSGGILTNHEGAGWTESQEIVKDATLEQAIARLKLFASGEVGNLVLQFNGESATFTSEDGTAVAIVVQRDSGGFLESVTLSMKSQEITVDVTISQYNLHDTEVIVSSRSNSEQSPQEPL
jgi:hypothetical protein